MTEAAKKYLWKADELHAHQRAFTQQLNPNSHLLRTGLSRLAGMQRAHVTLARIPSGNDSFAYHAHLVEEEWLYILSGRGIADIDGQQHEIGPGDFMGFPAPAVAHLLHNPFDTELVYLTGGEAVGLDVLDYPTLGKRFLLIYGNSVPEFDELTEPTRLFRPV